MRDWTRVEQLARDVRCGVRQVRRNPAFSGIAILTLALGIAVAALACFVPARRASRIDPMIALQHE